MVLGGQPLGRVGHCRLLKRKPRTIGVFSFYFHIFKKVSSVLVSFFLLIVSYNQVMLKIKKFNLTLFIFSTLVFCSQDSLSENQITIEEKNWCLSELLYIDRYAFGSDDRRFEWSSNTPQDVRESLIRFDSAEKSLAYKYNSEINFELYISDQTYQDWAENSTFFQFEENFGYVNRSLTNEGIWTIDRWLSFYRYLLENNNGKIIEVCKNWYASSDI